MRLITKVALGAAALVTATAATFPHGIGDVFGRDVETIEQRQALKLCQARNPAFMRFLASDRDQCLRQMRPVSGTLVTFSGVWSKPDREHMRPVEN
ncbi:MAG: hypothetical protein JO032_06860 [Alphaproteobacteria bacterium]|nr:hypothetical protein [Alphaproteobacteria bacterium]MBV9552496.1 hypothetical protein [Alphaproteobacteria bacterium]